MSKSICVMGTGYVGLIAAVGLADFGNHLVSVDVNKEKIDMLSQGKCPIYEPGVEEYLRRNLESGRLRFTTDIAEAIRGSEVVFIAVGTPPAADGSADLRFVRSVVKSIAENLNTYKVVVVKSTVPVGTNRWIKELLEKEYGKVAGKDFDVVSNPEFLREGKAISDFFHPDRTVIGYENPKAREIMAEVYRVLNVVSVPFVWCGLETAELIKYASNAFLATKIAYVNQLANLAEAVGADIHEVARGMGMDGRINPKFLHPGPGYGGSCFPKDTQALVQIGESHGVDMSIVKTVISSNDQQQDRMVTKLCRLLGKPADARLEGVVLAVLGVAFKQETDDIRESPAIRIVGTLLERGATVHIHDPKAAENFVVEFPAVKPKSSPYEAAKGADAIVILTEWNEYRSLDLDTLKATMRGKAILDARNLLDVAKVDAAGFAYEGVGRLVKKVVG